MSLTPDEVYRLAVAHGLDAERAIIATAIAWAESGLRPDAVGDVDLEDDTWGPSVGLWQVRSLRADTGTGRARDIERLGDPGFNAGAMVAVSAGGTNWQPWSVWKNGRYLTHVDAVRAAVSVTPVEIIRAVVAELEAAGIPVQFVAGWEKRGRPYLFAPAGVVCHHTATRGYDYDYPSLGIVRDGRSDLPGPLSQFGLGRHTGTVYVVAAGYANHAGGGGWGDLSGNGSAWGIEAENDGIGEEWGSEITRSYLALVTALVRHTGITEADVCRHAEWSDGGKIDTATAPFNNGDWIRAQVAERLAEPATPAPEEEFTMIIGDAPPQRGGGVWQSDGVFRKPVRTGDTWAQLGDDGAKAAKHIGVFLTGTFDDLIDIEAQLASLRPAPVTHDDVDAEGLDPQAVADLVVAKLGAGLAGEVADLLAQRLAS